jgi:hypothetical protein
MGAVRTATPVCATFPPRSQVGSGVSAVVDEPGFGGFEIADVKRLGASGEQERERAHGGSQPILVANDRYSVEGRCMARAEAGVGRHGISLDVAGVGTELVQQPNFSVCGDFLH